MSYKQKLVHADNLAQNIWDKVFGTKLTGTENFDNGTLVYFNRY